MAKENTKSKKKTTVAQLFAGLKVERLGLYFSLLGTLLYLQTITFDFTQDDAIVITENMFTTQGIKGIPGIFGNDTFYGYFKDRSKLNLVSGGRYRPLTPAMFAVEYALAAGKPWFSHLINAICYGLLCWMIFGFARALFNQRMGGTQAIQAAALTAVIFAVHPIHTEAVANIKGRDEIVAAMGAVLGLWLMIRSLNEDKSTALLFGAAISFFAGLLAKENVITILAVAPVTLWWYNKKPGTKWMRSLWPIIAASLLFLIIRFSVTGLSVGKPPIELMNNPFLKVVDKTYVPFSFGEKTSTIMYTMGKYAQLLLFPYPLTHDYYPRHIEIQNWGKPLVLLSLLFWLGLLWLVIRGWKSRTWLAYGIIFYCCTMSITSNIVFPIGTNMSERFAFLPSVGFALIAGVGASNWLNRSNGLSAKAIIIAVLVVLAGWTLVRSRVWISNHVLFSTDVHTSKHSAKLLNAAGGDLVTMAYSEKDPQKKKEELAQAQDYLTQAIEIHPNYKLSYLLLGNSYFYLGDYEKAIQFFRAVLVLDPDYDEGRKNLGIALRDYGKYMGEKSNNLTGAISMLDEAVKYLPNDFETYHLLGVAHGQKGETDLAIQYFKKEIELNPKNASAYFNLGVAYRHAGDEVSAKKYFDQARAIDPDLPQLKGQQ